MPPLTIPIILFILGIIGTILPLLPGVSLIWLGMLVYGIITGFQNLTVGFFILQGIAALLVMSIDYFSTAIGTKRFGGTKTAIWGAALGLLAGIIVLGPFGLIIGPFIGALLGSLLQGIPLEKAILSSFGALIGLLGGMFLKIIIEIIMIYAFFRYI